MYELSYIGMDHSIVTEEYETLKEAREEATYAEEHGAQCVTITNLETMIEDKVTYTLDTGFCGENLTFDSAKELVVFLEKMGNVERDKAEAQQGFEIITRKDGEEVRYGLTEFFYEFKYLLNEKTRSK